MTDANMTVWDSLARTDPAHTKAFSRAGGFKGTAIKPQWVIMRLTEEFGPCGVGWGINEPSFQVVPAGGDVVVFCTVSCWHTQMSNVLWGVGGDKVMVQRQSGAFVDDEAFKKSFTDAIMNAFKFLGVAADVHMGKFDDNKYVAEQKEAFKAPTEPRKAPGAIETGDQPPRDRGPSEPGGKDFWKCEGPGMTAHAAKAAKLDDVHEQMRSELDRIPTAEAWRKWADDNLEDIQKMPLSWRMILRTEAEERGVELGVFAKP